ncbi:hypothetical protein M0805_008238 [Coniferiporia weirii]|nr:hypothetical protein M0805_008238 [Coniferiporia weirii]
MNKCSAELIALIVEHACASDPGKTARSLGLVSKYFRALAEPLELRALVVAGPEQLNKTIAKVERARLTHSSSGSDGAGVDVRHLFVSELKPEHASAMDTSRGNGIFWGTPAGQEAWLYYCEHIAGFWESVSTLIHDVSTTLVTLAVIQVWNRAPTQHFGLEFKALSGVHLPQLKSLTLKNTWKDETYIEEINAFIPPTLPSLQRLQIIARPFEIEYVYDDDAGDYYGQEPTLRLHLHPLLKGMHLRSDKLTHLVICDAGTFDIETLASILSGSTVDFAESARTWMEDRRLPGRLVSAELLQGDMPKFRFEGERVQHVKRITSFTDTVNALCIHGLEAYPPTLEDPREGANQYEALLAEWMGRALEYQSLTLRMF